MLTTSQVAERLGMNRKALIIWLKRHPDQKPTNRIHPSNDFLWTDEDIEKVAEARKKLSKGGRPPKGHQQ